MSKRYGKPVKSITKIHRNLHDPFGVQSKLRRLVGYLVGAAILIAVSTPVHAQERPDGQTSAPRLKLEWEDRFLTVSGQQIPGGPIRIHYLEAYCKSGSTDRDWQRTVIPHESKLLYHAPDKSRLEIRDRLADGVVVTHVIDADDDQVRFHLTAVNPTETPSDAQWAQPCVRVDRFTGADAQRARELRPPYIHKCFVVLDGRLTRLPTKPWASRARYTPGQVYAAPGVDRNDVNPRPLSSLVPSCGLTGCFSSDETKILAIAWKPYQEVFQGVITCMHSDLRIGGLAPGATKHVSGRLYLVHADTGALLARYEKDFGK